MPLPAKDASIGDRELAMAEQLIEGMMTDWEPAKYRDHFYADVMKMIEEKAKTGTVKPKLGKERGQVANNVVDLLDLLKKSVASKGGHANDAQRAQRAKKPGSKKATRRTHKKHEAA
jgi:DNA end-binding protein Ku